MMTAPTGSASVGWHSLAARLLTSLGLLLCSFLLTACEPSAPPPPQAPAPIVQGRQLRFAAGHPQLKLLNVTSAQAANSVTVELPAKLVWNEERTQRIYSAFAGRVVTIRADLGQRVAAGAALAVLASPEFAQAQSDTARAEADESLAAQSLQRQRELYEAGIAARKDLEQAQADYLRVRAELERTQARTRLYGSTAGVNQELVLRASLPGTVVERNINPGQELRADLNGPGIPALFVVTDPTTLWIQIDARESEAGLVQAGTRFVFSVDALPGQVFKGLVIAASDSIDPLTRTIKIRGLVDNSERRLKAEMLATARFERRFKQGVVVPATAVLLRGSEHIVFVQIRPGEFEQREVEPEYEGPQQVVLSKGLKAGERVVVENTLLLARMLRLAQEEARVDGSTGDKPVEQDRRDSPLRAEPK